MRVWRSSTVGTLSVLFLATAADTHPLTEGRFNVESGGASIKTVAKHVTVWAPFDAD